MSETGERAPSRRWLWIALLVLLYVGSAAPVTAWSTRHDRRYFKPYSSMSTVTTTSSGGTEYHTVIDCGVTTCPPTAIRYFYEPVNWLSKIPPFAKPMDAYANWWFRMMM